MDAGWGRDTVIPVKAPRLLRRRDINTKLSRKPRRGVGTSDVGLCSMLGTNYDLVSVIPPSKGTSRTSCTLKMRLSQAGKWRYKEEDYPPSQTLDHQTTVHHDFSDPLRSNLPFGRQTLFTTPVCRPSS